MDSQHDNDFFRELNFYEMQRKAADWAQKFPGVFKSIRLYSGTSYFGYRFVIVAFIKFNRFTKDEIIQSRTNKGDDDSPLTDHLQTAYDFFKWEDPSCMNIRDDLCVFYKENPDYDPLNKWAWLTIEPRDADSPNDDDDDSPVVIAVNYWTLYEAATDWETREALIKKDKNLLRLKKNKRSDLMDFEIEAALDSIGHDAQPRDVMAELKKYAGSDKSCIIADDKTTRGVIWRDAAGTKKILDHKKLQQRLSKKRKNTP